MKSKALWRILGGIGILFILSSLVITLVELNRFNHRTKTFPTGSTIGGIPVGGLDTPTAAERLGEIYGLPIILEINGNTIHATPDRLGFNMDAEDLVRQAEDQIDGSRFWDHLWNKTHEQPVNLEVTASLDDNQVLSYLDQEIVPRYLEPGQPITPIPGTTNFRSSTQGEQLDTQNALEEIQMALISPGRGPAILRTETHTIGEASTEMLQAFLRHQINLSDFDELTEFYLESMETGETLHFALQDGVLVEPNIAFTAASTIKIPIMISVLRRLDEPTPEQAVNLIEQMIIFSENGPADTLMSAYLGEVRGPLIVSEDLAALGMQNTFLAGYFYLGAPVLQLFETPANTREDIFLDPDIFNQTVPAEAGQLLSGIYHCAEDGTGLLTETFPGEITRSECQLMIDVLTSNKIGLLIEAGLPPEASIGHKHGWVQELDGLLHSMSDVAIVSTPGGDYVLTVFLYDPEQLDFDDGNWLIARLSQTVYNFFNINQQAYWWFD